MKSGLLGILSGVLLFATMPTSTNYGIHNYGFGSGGTSNSTSSNYGLNATTGETGNVQSTSATYKERSGNNNSQQANVPFAPTFTNPATYYDKLKFVVNPGTSSPTDTKYSIAISSDGWVTTKYIQTDDTVASTIGIAQYQTYAAWGGSSGQLVIGLSPSTTYQIKVNAIQGKYTQTEYGTAASASTSAPSISFSIFTDLQGSPPFSVAFGSLLPATVITASNKIWTNISTNANSGAYVYVSSAFAGLKSTFASTTITSATANLSGVGTGYGAQGVSVTQTSGGPLAISSPFNVAAQNVGVLSTLLEPIFTSTGPITGGSGDFQLLAKAASSTPAAPDYADTLTLTAAASY